MTPDQQMTGWGALATGSAVAFGADGFGRLFDSLNRRFTADLYRRMEECGLPTQSLATYLRWFWTFVLAVFLVVWVVLGMPPVAVVAAVLLTTLARPVIGCWADRRRTALRNQLVSAARALANQARAGVALAQGLESVAQQTPMPLGAEFRRAMMEYYQGTPLAAALGEMKQRLKIESMTLFVVATLVCHERGGNLAFALDQICHSLEELQRVERKRESDTASGRLLVGILGAFPFLFLGLFYVLDPGGTSLVFSTAMGQIVLCVVGVLVFGSVRWASSILKIG